MKVREIKRRRPRRTVLGSVAWWREKYARQRRMVAAGVDGSWFRELDARKWRIVNAPD